MINYFIKPHPCLAVFVETYILSTSEESDITFTGNWAASNETSLVFYLADKPEHWVDRKGPSESRGIRNWVVGLPGTLTAERRAHLMIAEKQ